MPKTSLRPMLMSVVAVTATLLLIASYVAGCMSLSTDEMTPTPTSAEISLLPTSTHTPVPSPTPTPFPSGLAKKWHLVDVVINGEAEPPLAADFWTSAEWFWIDIERDGTITYSDGCNHVIHTLTVTRSGRFTIGGMVATTMLACGVVDPETGEFKEVDSIVGPNHVRFLEALDSVVTYELREGRLWLYYPRAKLNALVFR
jgi:heat shock protein HslJ